MVIEPGNSSASSLWFTFIFKAVLLKYFVSYTEKRAVRTQIIHAQVMEDLDAPKC